ncbi:MAG: polysaccharide deacetylase family protein, partial [Candidatus Aenigmarchaeota archaeon]|nr:polysaccharide deacetylase family protein [Candidatus Aenigmarchaeota archaeon]
MRISIYICLFISVLLLSLTIVSAQSLCQYASSASATSSSTGSEPIYATGTPDADGECSVWNGTGKSWNPAAWNIKANLTLNYNTSIYATNLTILGDYDMCWNKAWLKNTATGKERLIFNDVDRSCISTHTFNENFLADTLILETCGSGWTSTDAVELCGDTSPRPICTNGILETGEECDDGNLIDGDGCDTDCKLREPTETICQYALNAEATIEAPEYEAIYSTRTPDSDGNCSTAPSLHTAWKKPNWNILANLTLNFTNPIYPSNLTIFGDYDLCTNRIWLWRNDTWYLAWQGAISMGVGSTCKITHDLSFLNFKTDKIKIETCSWAWSAIDAVKFCGSKQSFPKITIINPAQDTIIDTSEKNVIIKISTDIPSTCKFYFEKYFDGGINLSTIDGLTHLYNLTKPLSMDSIELYYKCSAENKVNPYTVMHRFSFRSINNSFIDICNWYNCSEGAASISIDDGYHPVISAVTATCKEELENRGLKGTYFLAYTNRYNQSSWNLWKDVYNNGHEIGGHSLRHDCSDNLNQSSFVNDTQTNINQIINKINMSEDNLTTYAWPCGEAPPQYQEWLSDYYLFSRGYHFNSIESKNPENFINYRSINSPGYGDTPPDYYLLADVTDNYQGWANYVYHDSCVNPEIMDYLIAKGLWVDTIGSVSKYIMERNNVYTQNIRNTTTGVIFDLVNNLNATIFNKELTLQIYLGIGSIDNITLNGKNTEFTQFKIGNKSYVKFNVPPSNKTEIEIYGLIVSVPYCGDGKVNQKSEECDDGNLVDGDECSSYCKNEIKAYIVPYVGDLDGNIDPDWYFFYNQLRQWHDNNNLSTGFSFFPQTMNNNQFNQIIADMYYSKNIELLTKADDSYNGTSLDLMSYYQVRSYIQSLQDNFIKEMQNMNYTNVTAPVSYNQKLGMFTKTIRDAVHDLGFRIYFEQYISDYGYIDPLPDFDIIQYSVSFTVSGLPGPGEKFKQPIDIINEVLNFNVERMTYINGTKVIPLLCHQQDFRVLNGSSIVNETKWDIYTQTLLMAKNDPRIKILKPIEIYNIRRSKCIPTGTPENICNSIDDDCDGTVDEDYCQNKCIADIRYFNGLCQSNCTCNYNSTENCSQSNGWYDTNNTQWLSAGQCTEKQQMQQEYRNYYCAPSSCQYNVTNAQWIDTNLTRNKINGTLCNDTLFCTVNDQCNEGICLGSPRNRSDSINCTMDTCNEANDTIVHTTNNTSCNDNLFCNGLEFCSATLDCQSGTPINCSDTMFCTMNDRCDETFDTCISNPRDCSANNLPAIATCFNNPDSINYTWDFRNVFASVCDDTLDLCPSGNSTITHTCDVSNCGAQCDATSPCPNTECDQLDGCVGNDYYDYGDVPNTCFANCTCEQSACNVYTVNLSDNRCVPTTTTTTTTPSSTTTSSTTTTTTSTTTTTTTSTTTTTTTSTTTTTTTSTTTTTTTSTTTTTT